MIISVNDAVQLREYRDEDWLPLVRYLNDKVVYDNTLTIPYPYQREHAEHWINLTARLQEESNTQENFVIEMIGKGLAGGIGYIPNKEVSQEHIVEVGYWLGAPFRNQSLMTEVLNSFCRWIFDELPFTKITAHIFVHNPASGRVLEKCGFIREGYLRNQKKKDDRYLDCILYARIKE